MGVIIRKIEKEDRAEWNPLWQGYCDYYETEIPEDITENTWNRFFEEDGPIYALVAVNEDNKLVGLVHFLTHDSTWRKNKICYLEDLFVGPAGRRLGTGEKLINAVADEAHRNGWEGVYWHTKHENYKGRSLYDKVAGTSDFTHYSIDFD